MCNVLIALQCTLAAELMTKYSLHIMLLFTTWETYTGSETVTIRLDVQYILYKAFGTSIVLLFIETHEQAWCCESGMIYSGSLSS